MLSSVFYEAGISCQSLIPLAPYTTFHIGGVADCVVFPKTAEQAVSALRLCKIHSIPLHILGRGANLLVRDKGVRGVVLCTREMQKLSVSGQYVTAEAGVPLGKLLSLCQKNGLSGLQNLCGIPATVGGAVAMNAGAYGTEICQAVHSVCFFDTAENTLKTVMPKDFHFGYRHSLCHEKEGMICRVTFCLQKDDPKVILNRMKTVAEERKRKQPLAFPNAGSMFKRPFPHYAPRLIESAGLKGVSVGGACFSSKHAGFILNIDHAKAQDVETLLSMAEMSVWEQFAVRLEREIIIWGEE